MSPFFSTDRLKLRALESSDINDLLLWYNTPQDDAPGANVIHPVSKFTLELYIEDSHRPIHESGGQRFIISRHEDGATLGNIELYDFDALHRRAAVGIYIKEEERRKSYASEAIGMITRYAFLDLQLFQLYAEIPSSNTVSRTLFQGSGFQPSAVLPNWIWYTGRYHDLEIFCLQNTAG